jgi:hypothetical protein
MKIILVLTSVALAIYLFFLMITNIDFKGMDFSQIKLVVSICLGVAVAFISVKFGINLIVSAVVGFVGGALIFALIQTVIQLLFS